MDDSTKYEGVNHSETFLSQRDGRKGHSHSDGVPVANAPERALGPEAYTVGWICALSQEYVAAQVFLDEEHDEPEPVSENDNNNYTLGKVGKHNVVIAVLPYGDYGKSSAASVARDMLHSFPNIRIGLMVGIAGGVPGQHRVRLGDVVVSSISNGEGAVFEYDFGKAVQEHDFQPTACLNQPPTLLRAAVNGLKAQYERKGNQLAQNIDIVLNKNPRLRRKYGRPEQDSDRLFKSEITHDSLCTAGCSDDPSNLVLRPQRTEYDDNPAVHYGLIASADLLMEDALLRDKLGAKKGILCFETEAAGLMNHFPCLVIRGICDYADSHKNEEWQGYAAMAATAYANDLLRKIPPNKVENEKSIRDVYGVLSEQLQLQQEKRQLQEEHLDVAKKRLKIQEDTVQRELSQEQQKCLQLFRLTESDKDTTYEWYKDRVDDRVEGTCQWFLRHENFQKWLKQENGPLLVSADPGCGKSVLTKYLVDHELPKTSATVCYFFFKNQDQNKVYQALCALLHQLLFQKPSLICHAMEAFEKNGENLVRSTDSLWTILQNCVQDPQAGPVILVLDALDECAELEFENLVRKIENQFCSNQPHYGQLKYLLTCRPYDQIVSKFRSLSEVFQDIRIPGEEKSEIISHEVNLVIKYWVNQLFGHLQQEIQAHLEQKLNEITHRTYLWVYLVFDYLENECFKKTPNGIDSAVSTLPKSIDEAYENILNKSKNKIKAREVLSIILAANKPMTLSEMNVAINTDYPVQSIHDLDLEDEGDFQASIRSWCGLFISIHQNQIYFLHQTAREFLLAKSPLPTGTPSTTCWKHSISTQDAHTVLTERCVLYLNFFNYLPANTKRASNYFAKRDALFHYSARNWGAHFRKADIRDDAKIIPFYLKICDPNSQSYSEWFKDYRETPYMAPVKFTTNLTIASYFGHSSVVKLLLAEGAEIEIKDDEYGRTPLSWAAENGHEAVVKLLLERGAEIETKDNKYGQTPLLLAARKGHKAIIKLLLEKDAEIETKDNKYGRTPLSWAAKNGYEAIVKLLLENGAEIETKDDDGQTPLLLAAREGHIDVVRLLLEKWQGDKISISEEVMMAATEAPFKVDEMITLLLDWLGNEIHITEDVVKAAARNEQIGGGVMKLLIDRPGDKIHIPEDMVKTAATCGQNEVLDVLFRQDGPASTQDEWRDIAKFYSAARDGDIHCIEELLHKGTNPDMKDVRGRTPLWIAASRGHEKVVNCLAQRADVDVNAVDNTGESPLFKPSIRGHEQIVAILMEAGADPHIENEYGYTAIEISKRWGSETITQILERSRDLGHSI